MKNGKPRTEGFRAARRWLSAILAMTLLLGACGSDDDGRDRDEDEERERTTTSAADKVPGDSGGEKVTAEPEEPMPEVEEISEEIFEDYAEDADVYTCYEDPNRKVILLDLQEEREIGCVYLDWDADECGSVTSYRIETYEGGANEPPETEYQGGLIPQRKYVSILSADAAPYPTKEKIEVGTVASRYLRIDVEGADTVPEVRVFAEDPWEEVFDTIVPWVTDGKLVFLGVPDWLDTESIGCNPYAVLAPDGTVQEILEDTDVLAGCTLSYDGWSAVSPDYEITIPAASETAAGGEDGETNPRPQILPTVQEWRGGTGVLAIGEDSAICADGELEDIAEILAEDIESLTGWDLEINDEDEAGDGDIVLSFCDESSLGEEGYRIRIDDTVTICAEEAKGVYWGTRSLLQMMVLAASDAGDADTLEGMCAARIDADSVDLPEGEIRDYPSYPVRGFELDVARNSVSMHSLREMAKNLSWYKINEFTIHLNDNALLAYSDRRTDPVGIYGAYSAFRLESSVIGSYGGPLTSQDLFYTKEEFEDLAESSAEYGVKIIPEIDTPAHSLAITSIFRYNGLKYSPEAADMLDLSQESTTDIVKRIWDDALPSFEDCDTVHIGGDEYYGDTDDYLRFENTMIDYLNEQDKTVRLWASLTGKRGNDYVQPRDDLELILWNTDWAVPEVMYDEGYRIINADHNTLYITPGGGYDRLDTEMIHDDFEVNRFVFEREEDEITLPCHDGRILGAQVCIWNDFCDNLDIGISEYDMYDRVNEALPYFSGKCWSAARTEDCIDYDTVAEVQKCLGQAPGSNPYDRVFDPDEIDEDDPESLLGPDYRVELELTVAGAYGELVLCSAERGGNTYTVYLRDRNGHIGFAREGREYAFEEMLPVGEAVSIAFVGHANEVVLYVDGKVTESIGSSEQQAEHATLLFPVSELINAQDIIREEGAYEITSLSGNRAVVTKIEIEAE